MAIQLYKYVLLSYISLVEVLEDLLDGKNAFWIRKIAIRLFLIWYQILGVNATTNCHQLFYHLVPEFGGLITEYQKRGESNDSGDAKQFANNCDNDEEKRSQLCDNFGCFNKLNIVSRRDPPMYLSAASIGDEETVI